MREKIFLVVAIAVAGSSGASAQSLDKEMAGLGSKISTSLSEQQYRNVAAIDFTDLQGQPTELGRFLSDQLAVEIVSAGSVSMLDRANIKSILAEHKLTVEGLVDPANAKKLGEFAGVDVLITGTVTALDSSIVLTVKAIATSSSRIVAAGKVSFPKTSEIQQLLNRGVQGPQISVNAAASSQSGRAGAYQEGGAIATKDIGPLRIVLRSALPIKATDTTSGPYRTQTARAIRCSFDFVNLETQTPIQVGFNASAVRDGDDSNIAKLLRSSLLDDNGAVWNAATLGATGLGAVGVGLREWSGPSYNPSEIVSLLERRDRTGSNADLKAYNRYTFVFGSMTPIEPGKAANVSLTFTEAPVGNEASPAPKTVQLTLEVVTAVPGQNGSKMYSLQTVTFYQVGLPSR